MTRREKRAHVFYDGLSFKQQAALMRILRSKEPCECQQETLLKIIASAATAGGGSALKTCRTDQPVTNSPPTPTSPQSVANGRADSA